MTSFPSLRISQPRCTTIFTGRAIVSISFELAQRAETTMCVVQGTPTVQITSSLYMTNTLTAMNTTLEN